VTQISPALFPGQTASTVKPKACNAWKVTIACTAKKIPIDRHSAHLANPTTLPTENPKTLVSSINNTTALSSQVWMEETMIGTPGRRRRRRKVLE
jgi:hypothetical protein